jgi:hypothetical protein
MIAALALSFLFGSAPGAPPQWLGAGHWQPRVGAWVLYRVEMAGGQRSYLRLSVLGRERVEGRDAWWVQWVMGSSPETASVAVKMLTAEPLGGGAFRTLIRVAGSETREIPSEPPAGVDDPVPPAGKEEWVSTPAGKLRARRAERDGATIWLSEEIPIAGVARAKLPQQRTFEVEAYGLSGARDQVGEPPTQTLPAGGNR